MKHFFVTMLVVLCLFGSCSSGDAISETALYTTDGCSIQLDGNIFAEGEYALDCGYHEFSFEGTFLFRGLVEPGMHFFAEDGRLWYDE